MCTKTWASSKKTHIFLFNVNRGLSVFIRTPLNQGILYDLGMSENFSPTSFLEKNLLPHINRYKNSKLSQIVVSHPHADHIAEINVVSNAQQKTNFYPELHTCPHDNDGSNKPEKVKFERITNPKSADDLISEYQSIYSDRELPLRTITYDADRYVPNIEYGLYYVRPPFVESLFPENNQEYSNGISILLYYRHGHHTILIPGDINPDAMEHILEDGEGCEKRYSVLERSFTQNHPDWHDKNSDQPSLKDLMGKGLSVLIAPHHGLESGFSQDLYDSMKNGKPQIVAISEKRHVKEGDGTVDSRYSGEKRASGLNVLIEGEREFRRKVSTQNGHHILIEFQGTGGSPSIYLEKKPEKLLAHMS